jgi:hypothetical protein
MKECSLRHPRNEARDNVLGPAEQKEWLRKDFQSLVRSLLMSKRRLETLSMRCEAAAAKFYFLEKS